MQLMPNPNQPKTISRNTTPINIGDRFGEWTVIGESFHRRLPSGAKVMMHPCRCSCGREANLQRGNLKQGLSTRCRNCAVDALVTKSMVSRLEGFSEQQFQGVVKAMLDECQRRATLANPTA
jgi:hypothetical protein